MTFAFGIKVYITSRTRISICIELFILEWSFESMNFWNYNKGMNLWAFTSGF